VDRLSEVGTKAKLPKGEYEPRLERAQKLLAARRLQLAGKIGDGRIGPPLCVVMEGWDASGKGGTIKRMVAELDSRHVRVKEFAAPTADEKRHHYLARFVPPLPGWGGMAVFDRSWYGRVLVERVEGFTAEKHWRRAYEEIVAFEAGLAREGQVTVKFWLHISAEEQLKRFKRRAGDPLKAWKLTDEDWRNREKRAAYCEALEDMFERTDHDAGHWHVIPADSKKYTRVTVIETTVAAVERALCEHGIEPLGPEELGL
jgi:polyphosphate kinase 2 (PPK2 family)